MMDEDYFSDTTPSCSSTSGGLLDKKSYASGSKWNASKSRRLSHPPSCLLQRARRRAGTRRGPAYRLSRKQSASQIGREKLCSDALCLSPRYRSPKKPQPMSIKEAVDIDWRGAGDQNTRRKYINQTQTVFPAFVQCQDTCSFCDSPNPHSFPFKNTPSGNLKLSPRQVIYESKNLSVVAADPVSITLNVADSGKTIESAKGAVENGKWDTTCLYTTVGAEGQAVFGSEFSETVSESEEGFVVTDPPVKRSELNLAKMGYVIDNCIDWSKFKLPKKSELQKLLLHNILNKTHPDIQVKVGSSVYNCHRIVLQCYCPYFISKAGPHVELPDKSVSKDSFSLIYQWMLHMEVESYRLLRRDNVLDILKTSKFLKIQELENQCLAFIESVDVFCEDKAFLLYIEAKQYNNKQVMEMMVPRVQRFFLTLVSSKEFVEFSCDEVCTFLRSNYICIHCEMEVFMAGVRWLTHDWHTRKSDVVEVMKCVRFGLINPKVLVTTRRNPQSPEFLQVANIPQVSNMIDDGVAFSILRSNYENDSSEEFQTSLKHLGLTYPTARNWAGTEKDYHSYQEFLSDLANYRTKQKLEIKRSKMKTQLDKVKDDDFLSSAVLPPSTQQKLANLNNEQNSMRCCIPHLEPKEVAFLKKLISQDVRKTVERKKLNEVGSTKMRCKTSSPNRTLTRDKKLPSVRQVSVEDVDLAARKIQKKRLCA